MSLSVNMFTAKIQLSFNLDVSALNWKLADSFLQLQWVSSAERHLSVPLIVTKITNRVPSPKWEAVIITSDIWLFFFRDHDDDVSVAEACKKLNEVSGLRGMGR